MGVVRPRRQRGRGGGEPHLLVRLHLAADHPEGVGGGVVIDLDAAEGLRARAGGQPALVAVIIEHHRGPAGAHNRLAAERRAGARGRGQLAVGSLASSPQGPVTVSFPWEIRRHKVSVPGRGTQREEEEDRPRERAEDRPSERPRQGDWRRKRRVGRQKTDWERQTNRQTGGCETDSQKGSKRQEEDESDRLEEANIQTDDGEREVRKGVRLLQGRWTEMDRETEMWRES